MISYNDGKVESILAGGGGPGPQGPQGTAGSGNQGPQGVAGTGGGLPIPGYAPPPFVWKDVDDLYIMPGRYYPMGHRISGQYQNTTIGDYWEVTAPFAAGALDTYSAGVTSGILGGKESTVWTWLSVFMTDADEILFLPWVRVPSADYNVSHTGKTTITPGDNNGAATTYLVTAADQFNGYRLVKHSYRSDPYHGFTATIEDTVNDTADELIIDGDVTDEFGTGDTDSCTSPWLQIIPPVGTSCLYLGQVMVDGSNEIQCFQRFSKWGYVWRYAYKHGLNISATNTAEGFALTSMRYKIPPTAMRAVMVVVVGSSADYQYGHACYLTGENDAGNYVTDWAPNAATFNIQGGWLCQNGNSDWSKYAFPTPWYMTYPSAIRNRAFGINSGTENTNCWGWIHPYVFEE